MGSADENQLLRERQLIAMALSPRRWPELQETFDAGLFANDAHRAIAAAILDEATANPKRPPGVIAVQNRLGERGDLLPGVLEAARHMPMIAPPAELVGDLKRRAAAREASALLDRYAKRLADPKAEAAAELAALQADIGRMQAQAAPVQIQSLGEIASALSTRIAQTIATGADPVIPVGLVALNETMGGLKRKECVVLCGRPGAGKSAALGHVLEYTGRRRGVRSLLFSLEMPGDGWAGRIACRDASIPSALWATPTRWSGEMAAKAAQALDKLAENDRVFICDRRGLDVDEICAYARAFKRRHDDLEILAVDHLQLVEPSGRNRDSRTRELGKIAKQLRDLSDELDVALVLLAQLNREAEKENRPPRMSDLRDSGEVEEHADVIVGLWRPNPDDDTVQFQTLKGRNIANGAKSFARFVGPFFRWEDGDRRGGARTA